MEILDYIFIGLECLFIGTAILVIVGLYIGDGLMGHLFITIVMSINIVIFVIATTYCCIVWGKKYIEKLKEQKNENM